MSRKLSSLAVVCLAGIANALSGVDGACRWLDEANSYYNELQVCSVNTDMANISLTVDSQGDRLLFTIHGVEVEGAHSPYGGSPIGDAYGTYFAVLDYGTASVMYVGYTRQTDPEKYKELLAVALTASSSPMKFSVTFYMPKHLEQGQLYSLDPTQKVIQLEAVTILPWARP